MAAGDVETHFEPLQYVRIPDKAVQQISDMIAAGTLKPGDRLPPERDLVQKLGVGRSSIREAIRILEAMGLLLVKPGVGTFIAADAGDAALTAVCKAWLVQHRDNLLDMIDVREALECRALVLAANVITEEEIDYLERVVQEMEKCVAAQDVKGIVVCDREFHDRIAQASRNQFLVAMNASLYEAMDEARTSIFTVLPEVRGSLVREHRVICEALNVKDGDAAQRGMVFHMDTLREDIAVALGRQSSPDAGADA